MEGVGSVPHCSDYKFSDTGLSPIGRGSANAYPRVFFTFPRLFRGAQLDPSCVSGEEEMEFVDTAFTKIEFDIYFSKYAQHGNSYFLKSYLAFRESVENEAWGFYLYTPVFMHIIMQKHAA